MRRQLSFQVVARESARASGLFALVLCVSGIFSPLVAQAVSPERQAVFERYLDFDQLLAGGSVNPVWMADGSSFWFAEGPPNSVEIYKVDAASGKLEPFFDTARLRSALQRTLGHPPATEGVPFNTMRLINDEQSVLFKADDRLLLLDLETYAISEPADDYFESERQMQARLIRNRYPHTVAPVVEIPSPDGKRFASLQEFNLAIRSSENDEMNSLTSDGIEDFAWDAGPWAAKPWAQWSRDGKLIAATKYDLRGVHKTPDVHWLGARETITYELYPLVGEVMPRPELYVINAQTGQRVRIDSGSDDQYVNIEQFSSDGTELYFSRLSRDLKRFDLMAADVSTGKTRTILTDTQDTFLIWGPIYQSTGAFTTFLKDGQHVILESERDGWSHFYLYNLDGTLVRQLTRGDFPVLDVVYVDEKAGELYFTAHSDPKHIYDKHLLKVGLDGRGLTQLTEATGTHQIRFAPSGQYYLDTHSNLNRPPVAELRSAAGKLLRTVSSADISALEKVGWTAPEAFIVKAADNKTDLHGVIYKPYDFDPKKKYPVLEYIYGGGFISIAQPSFSATTGWLGRAGRPDTDNAMARAFAQLGFITFIVDARGTTGRTKAFQDVVYGNLGRFEIEDHATAMTQVAATRPYMDMSRVGIFGISFGGYFTVRALLQRPDLYKVGVASGPAEFGPSMRSSGAQVYSDLFLRNPAAHEYSRNALLADQLEGKLRIIIGTSDMNTPFAHSMQLADAFVRANKPVEMVVVPEANHVFVYKDSAAPQRYWINANRDHLVEHLRPWEN